MVLRGKYTITIQICLFVLMLNVKVNNYSANFGALSYYCASWLNVTPVFAVYSSMAISIEKEITEMNLDKDRVIRLFFALMPRLHLPRSSYDLFVYDFPYDFFMAS